MRIGYFINFVSIFTLLLCSLATVRADTLDDLIQREMASRKMPAVSIAVLKQGKIVRERSYGFASLELRTPATKDSVYEIGSISKQFAAEAVMLLAEEGKLNVDDSITKYLPTNAPLIWRSIKVRNLLNHTSGLKDWTEIKEFSYRREYTPEEFIDLVKDFPLQFQPNENWLYSNTNLPLIGIIVEKVSGQSFESYVTERIIKLLKFPSIRFKHQDDIVPDRANGYALRNGVLKNGEPFRPRVIAASGGILATATDLAKWWEAVMKLRVVKKESLNQMLAPVKLLDGRTVAHGFAFFTDTFNGHKMIQHFGSTVGGFGSIVRYYPREDVTVAVICNLEDGGFGAEYIAKRVVDRYIPGAFAAGMKESVDLSPDQTKLHLQVLKDTAANETSGLTVPNYLSKINAAFQTQLVENLSRMKSFVFLGHEKFTVDHFMLDATADEVYHYKMVLSDKTVYYHIRFNTEHLISWISSEV